MKIVFTALSAFLLLVHSGGAFAQEWESLGPGIGYRPEAFFVSKNAIYLGLSEDDWTNGFGLFRYRFDSQQWEYVAWDGYRILGVTVWGEFDENILLIRCSPSYDSDILRSTDGGATWMVRLHRDSVQLAGMTQSRSDTSRVLVQFPPFYSSDGGMSWDAAGGDVVWGGPYDATFDPTDASIAYLTGRDSFGDPGVYKSLTGGATWFHVFGVYGAMGIDVEPYQATHVMGGNLGFSVPTSSDAGDHWSVRDAPLITNAVFAPPWSPGSFFVAGFDSTESYYDVWQARDLGTSWSRCGEGLPAPPGQPPGSLYSRMYIEGHPTQPILYVALEGRGVWRWQYAGADAPTSHGSPSESRLLAFPTPTAGQLTYGVRLANEQSIVIQLFDAQGRLLETLRRGMLPAGTHVFHWDGRTIGGGSTASGVYHLTLNVGGNREERKIVVLR